MHKIFKYVSFFSFLIVGTFLIGNQVNAYSCSISGAYFGRADTQINVCPVPPATLRNPTVSLTGKLYWDFYEKYNTFDPDTITAEQGCLNSLQAKDMSGYNTIKTCLDTRSQYYKGNKCPYGIARWNGQCTYKSLTVDQKPNWSCVMMVRADKLVQILTEANTQTVCKIPDGTNTSGAVDFFGDLYDKAGHDASTVKFKIDKNGKIALEQDLGDPIDIQYGEFTYSDTLLLNVAPGANNVFSVSYKNQVLYNDTLGYNFDHSWNKYIMNGEFFDGSLNKYSFPGGYSKVLNARILNNENGYTITFDADNSKMYFQDINGDGTYKIVKQEFSNGLSYNLSYNELGKINTISDTLGRITMFNYNLEYLRLEQVTDPSGRAVFFDYYMGISSDGLTGDLKSITVFHDGEYKTTSFAYDTSVTYVYDKKGKIIDVIVDHVKSHNMKRMVDAKGVVYVTNVYDANDRVTAQTYGNHTLNYSYQLNGDAVVGNTVTNRKGQVTNYAFDSNGNTTSFTAGGETYKYTYDADSQLLVELLPNGNATRYEYDNRGNVTTMTQTDGVETITQSYTYTTDGKIATATSPDNIQTTYTYSPGGLILSQSAKPLDNSKASIGVNYTYNYHNLIDTVSLPDGQRIKYTYNENDQVIKVERNGAKGETVINLINYDQYGNPISMSDGEGNVTQLGYNARDQVKQVTSPSGIKQYLQYDKTNNLTKSSLLLENGNYAWQTMSYDILDNPTSIDYAINATINAQVGLGYDPNENTEKTVDPNGVVRHYEYDAFQRATKKYTTILSNGEVQKIIYTYTYDSVGNVIKTTDPKGHEISIEYNWLGQAVKVTNEQGTYAVASYDSNYSLIGTEIYDKDNKLQQKQTYTYDSRGNVLTSTQHDVLLPTRKLTTTMVYDTLNRVVSVTDPKGGITNYTYDGLGRVESLEDAMGRLQTNLYNNNDQVIAEIITTAEGKTLSTYYDYDKEGRLVKSTNHVGYTQYFNYNNLHQLVSKTDQEGNKISYKYDYLGNLTQEIKNDGKTNIYTTYTYDNNGNLTSLTDGNGNKTNFTYDGLDRQTKKVLPDGTVTTYRYDMNDNLVKRTDPNGNAISNTYDILDRLTDRKISLGKNVGGITSETYKYDALGRLVYSNDSQNNELKFEFNGLGSLSKETNNGKSVDYVNNNYNDLLEIVYPSGKKFAYNYDMDNRLVEISESKGQTEGTTTPTIGALKSIILNQYDSATLQKTVYGNTTETNYKYDTLLRLKELQHANFKTPAPMDSIDYAFTYDKESNIVQNGQDTFWYDDVYRLTNVQYNNGNLVKRQNGTLTKGANTEITPNPSLSTGFPSVSKRGENERKQEWKYDPAGNRKTEFNNVPGIAIKEDIVGYQTINQNSTMSDDKNVVVADDDNKISNILSFGNNTATKSKESGKMSLVVGSSLQAKGGGGGGSSSSKLNSNAKSNGKGEGEARTKTNGNANYNGKGADSGLKKGRDKTAKNNALKGRCQRKNSGAREHAPLSKCKGVGLQPLTVSVNTGYVDGLPTLFTGQKPVVPNDTVTYNANNLNQYTSVAYGTASINLKYDRNGNMIENEKFKFTYDYKNRLIKAELKPTTTSPAELDSFQSPGQGGGQDYLVDTFTYDTLGRRLTKWIDTKSNVGRYIKYIYSNENAIEEEWFYNIGEGREQTKEYVYGQGTDDVVKVYIEKQGKRSEQWFYKDNQGSIVAIADEYGKIVESYRYDAFGNLILGYQSNSIKFNLSPSDKNAQTNTANGSKSWITNSRLYTSREYDQELDLYYYRGRTYDARMGRFIQRDPIGYADDVNLYTYVGNNPMNYVDPRGLAKCKKFLQEHDATELFKELMAKGRRLRTKLGYFSDTTDKYNVKIQTRFQKIAFSPYDHDKTCEKNYNSPGECLVYVDGIEVSLSELGNFLIGYNGYYVGMKLTGESENILPSSIYEAGMRYEIDNYSENPILDEEQLEPLALADELLDRPWYDYGYAYARSTSNSWLKRKKANSISLGSAIQSAKKASKLTEPTSWQLKFSTCDGDKDCMNPR